MVHAHDLAYKLSVIIPTYKEPVSLWHTYAGFKMQLDELDQAAEIIVANNGPDNMAVGTLLQRGVQVVDVPVRSTSAVRNAPAWKARGEILCFADNHVVLCEGFVRRALAHFDEHPGVAAVFGATHMWDSHLCGYHNVLDIDADGVEFKKSFTALTAFAIPERVDKTPYLIASGSHGCYFIRSSVFHRIGGYIEPQMEWGGEEVSLNLLLSVYGYQLMMDPGISHWHLPTGFRVCVRNMKPLMVNHMMSAYVLGGLRWMEPVYEHFRTVCPNLSTKDFAHVVQSCHGRMEKVKAEAEISMDDVFDYFETNGIAYK